MQDHPRSHQTQYWIAAAVLIVLVAAVAAVFAISYRAGLAALIGVGLALLLAGILRLVARHKRACLVPAILAALAVLLAVAVLIFFRPHLSQSPPGITCPVGTYRVAIDPVTPRLQQLRVQEAVILVEGTDYQPPADWTPALVDNQPGYLLPPTQAQINRRGFLLREAVIANSVTCRSAAFVELNDFPLNAFYAAVYADNLQHYPYVDTETITWRPGSRDVRFSYISPPFQFLRPVLAPLMGASSASQWAIGIISVLGTLVFVPIIQPVLVEMIQKILKKQVAQRRRRKPI